MLRWRGLEDIPADWGRCVVTIGVFDGVHRGHAQLIATATSAARRLGVPTVLMTFDPHPAEVVRPGSHPPQLSTLTRRAELAEELGVDVFCVMPFTPGLAAQSAKDFAHQVLVEGLHATGVVVGANFTFGRKAAGTVEVLAELGRTFGFEVQAVSLLGEQGGDANSNGVTISSTYIRSCVAAGDVEAAAEALGRPHRVEGVVVRGDGRGREMGFPTANVAPPMYSAIPADGVYAAWFTVLGAGPVVGQVVPGESYRAAVSVGSNPTFSGRTRTVEAYVLDTQADLYGQHVAVDFVSRLRGQVTYSGRDPLIDQMNLDVEATRAALA
ncbi:bifunctional riboflavin kinase/FAD synthetase [Williamsia sp. CHRR-6]|uniref:bifunctional riboflavin kinase/FAD synthetase n=1 Tax=Williamsia sp. CHRR-6 TaxID=2835871 RepID=UPI001BDA3BD5|nr:bifunctional riboflavin kinase/FAD synthetase [Williamsia sp. CHRR-6]MBT0567863.1 bifunctional riboflavin kinase/FAD synthetase [Williamsia sp. CHRR-6]